jgi:Protein of unknown function (DUF3224)
MTARGTFKINLTPGPPELQGAVDRYDFTKTFTGDLQANGAGLMLSCGDPATGAAGYVAIETVRGSLGDRRGGFVLQQLGMMRAGGQTLHYEVIPGSGDGELKDIGGTFHLIVDEDGTHRYELEYDLRT